jgi:hypothetical protein
LQRLLDGETGIRTRDTTIFSRVLYQLSYLAATPDPSVFGPSNERNEPGRRPPLGRVDGGEFEMRRADLGGAVELIPLLGVGDLS